MSLRLNGSTSGYVELDAPATAGSNTLVLPDGNGTSGQYLQTDGSGALSWQTVATSNITYSTAQATTSGTAVDFTDVPSGVKKITLMFDQVSTSGADRIVVLLSTGGVLKQTGYDSASMRIQDGTAPGAFTSTTNFTAIASDNTIRVWKAMYVLTNISGNKWLFSGTGSDDTRAVVSNGVVDLGGAIDNIRIATDTNVFDGGQVNVMYEV